MGVLGKIKLEQYLKEKQGVVTGQIVTDGKFRRYRKKYTYQKLEDGAMELCKAP